MMSRELLRAISGHTQLYTTIKKKYMLVYKVPNAGTYVEAVALSSIFSIARYLEFKEPVNFASIQIKSISVKGNV